MSQVEKIMTANARSLTNEQLRIRSYLGFVQSDIIQKIPEEYIRAYGSEIAAYAHGIGGILLKEPKLTIEMMIEAAELATGPHKETVIEALREVRRRMESDKEEFIKWAKINKV